MKIDTRKQSGAHLGWSQLGPNTRVGEAIKKGKQLRIDCRTCGRRFFDLKLAIAAKKVREEWSRDDVRRKFSCNREKRKKSPSPCAINAVAFEVHFQDLEGFGP